jgi:hypothetical protein
MASPRRFPGGRPQTATAKPVIANTYIGDAWLGDAGLFGFMAWSAVFLLPAFGVLTVLFFR